MSVSGWGMNTRPETSQAMGNEEGENKEMSGWLWSRESKNGRNWQRRWCVVQSGLLEVYSSHVMLKMVTCIPLDDCTVEKVMSSAVNSPSDSIMRTTKSCVKKTF